MKEIDKQTVTWALEELASRDEQERLWLSDGSSGEVSSFTEAICGVFDDGGVSRAIDSGNLSGELAGKFKALETSIRTIPEDVHPKQQIDHPAMKDIAKLSEELLKLLAMT